MLLALNDRLQHTCQLGKVAGEFDVDVSAALLRHHFGQCLLDGLQRGFDVGAAALVAQNGHKLTIRRNDRALCKVQKAAAVYRPAANNARFRRRQ